MVDIFISMGKRLPHRGIDCNGEMQTARAGRAGGNEVELGRGRRRQAAVRPGMRARCGLDRLAYRKRGSRWRAACAATGASRCARLAHRTVALAANLRPACPVPRRWIAERGVIVAQAVHSVEVMPTRQFAREEVASQDVDGQRSVGLHAHGTGRIVLVDAGHGE